MKKTAMKAKKGQKKEEVPIIAASENTIARPFLSIDIVGNEAARWNKMHSNIIQSVQQSKKSDAINNSNAMLGSTLKSGTSPDVLLYSIL